MRGWALWAWVAWGLCGAQRQCWDGPETWECVEPGREVCARLRSEDGGSWQGCLPASLLSKADAADPRLCRPLHSWEGDEPRLRDLLPHWLASPALLSPHSRFSIRLERRRDDDRLVCPLSGQAVLSGGPGRWVTCPAGTLCCLAWTPGEGSWAGREMGLGCESCDVGLGHWDFQRWRGGGGGQLLPALWPREAQLCLWPSTSACWEGDSVRHCPVGWDCCTASADGQPSGCAVCPPSLGCVFTQGSQVCSCRGNLCNSPGPVRSKSRGVYASPPAEDRWPRPASAKATEELLAATEAPRLEHRRVALSGAQDVSDMLRILASATDDVVAQAEAAQPDVFSDAGRLLSPVLPLLLTLLLPLLPIIL